MPTSLTAAALGFLASLAAAAPSLAQAEHQVVELRQYTLHPGQRETLTALFDSTFVESQEALGARIVGQFRDLDHPDRFVWMRSFADMPARATALNGFYFGPVWQAHRNAANATIADSDNVLLLKPLRPGSGFTPASPSRPAPTATGSAPGLIVLQIHYVKPDFEGTALAALARKMAPVMAEAGGPVRAWLTTEPSPNTFPRLPVREGERVLVTVSSFADAAAYEGYQGRLARLPAWRALEDQLGGISAKPSETLRLTPTARSDLKG